MKELSKRKKERNRIGKKINEGLNGCLDMYLYHNTKIEKKRKKLVHEGGVFTDWPNISKRENVNNPVWTVICTSEG